MVHKKNEVYRKVFNLTEDIYYTWAASGELTSLPSDDFSLPDFVEGNVAYIVDEGVYKEAEQKGRPTSDLVVAKDFGRTLTGVNLTKLIAYDDKDLRVYPIKGA